MVPCIAQHLCRSVLHLRKSLDSPRITSSSVAYVITVANDAPQLYLPRLTLYHLKECVSPQKPPDP
jgi:hypothetical protein